MVIYNQQYCINNILYAIWYDMSNIANSGTTKYGNIQVNNILYTTILSV